MQQEEKAEQRIARLREAVGSLMAKESQCAAICGKLGRQIPGKATQVKGLEEACQRHIRILRGVDYLVPGAPAGQLPLRPRQETLTGLLRTGYLQCIKGAREYRRWMDDEEYGPCFQILAEEKQRQSLAFLEILGSL